MKPDGEIADSYYMTAYMKAVESIADRQTGSVLLYTLSLSIRNAQNTSALTKSFSIWKIKLFVVKKHTFFIVNVFVYPILLYKSEGKFSHHKGIFVLGTWTKIATLIFCRHEWRLENRCLAWLKIHENLECEY